MYHIEKGECLELMKKMPDNSIDMILCDLPYGMTAAEWDVIIPFAELWEQYRRVAKKGAHIVLFSVQPFTTKLINSNLSNYKYNWYWKKNNVTGGQNAKVQPMRCIEDICVFRFDIGKDNSGMFTKCREYLQREKEKCGKTLKQLQELLGNSMTSHYFTYGQQFSLPTKENYQKLQTTGFFEMPYEELVAMYNSETEENPFIYNPQGIIKLKKKREYKGGKSEILGLIKGEGKTQEYTNYPTHLLEFKNESCSGVRYHPTQKSTKLLEYLIKTYTNIGDTVLDNCMGSGSTGVACINTNRKFIGFELTDKYFDVAKQRLENAKQNKQQANDEWVADEEKTSANVEQMALF